MRRSIRPPPLSPLSNAVFLLEVALVPIVLLAVVSIVLSSNQVTRVVDKQVETTAATSSVVIGQQTTDLVRLLHSYAGRPSLIAAISAGSPRSPLIDSSLASLTRAFPGISASFIADLEGTSLNTYPYFPKAVGMNFAYREWYKGLVASGRPYVSSAIVTEEAGHTLAVTVTDNAAKPKKRSKPVLPPT